VSEIKLQIGPQWLDASAGTQNTESLVQAIIHKVTRLQLI